ncbi:MAG: RNA polymerase sigma factor RpoH, partial [Alphaproteobacteria bacterium]|nr:RNA polymerase sigma factor RpoH [Alphaproteobacteria bacterium]
MPKKHKLGEKTQGAVVQRTAPRDAKVTYDKESPRALAQSGRAVAVLDAEGRVAPAVFSQSVLAKTDGEEKAPTGIVVSVEEAGLSRYLHEIKKYPLLKADEEKRLAMRWLHDGDRDAAHQLVTSHLRLVAKIAYGYRGYGLPMSELISEGNIGLMQAVRKFEPEKGFRLSTYAIWWIKASINEYVLRTWSLVKIGTTAAQKKLFFNLNKAKAKLHNFFGDALTHDQVKSIASNLSVEEKEVEQMEQRMGNGGDQSLNAPRGGEDGAEEWQSFLPDKTETPDTKMEVEELSERRHQTITQALSKLSVREREIVLKRHLGEEVVTLEDLSHTYGVSRERVRQIESRALEKLKSY